MRRSVGKMGEIRGRYGTGRCTVDCGYCGEDEKWMRVAGVEEHREVRERFLD